MVQTMHYTDSYVRQNGAWYFRKRRPRAWYNADVLEQPAAGERIKWKLDGSGLTPTAELPEAWPTWNAFYAQAGGGQGDSSAS